PRGQRHLRQIQTVALESGLKKEREVIRKLQRIACANFLKSKEAPIAGANYQWARLERTVGKTDPWREVGFVGVRKMLGISWATSRNDDSFCVVKVARPAVCVVNRRGVVVAQPKIHGQVWPYLVTVFYECAVGVLPIMEESDRRDHRRDRQPEEHVGNTVTAVQLITGIHSSVLTAERHTPARLRDLLHVELVPAELRSHLDHVLAVNPANRIVQL